MLVHLDNSNFKLYMCSWSFSDLLCFAEGWQRKPWLWAIWMKLAKRALVVLKKWARPYKTCVRLAPVRPAAVYQFNISPDLSSYRLHPPLSISGSDPTPDSLLEGPSWAAAAASCLLTPGPPLLPVLGQTRLKSPLPSPHPSSVLAFHTCTLILPSQATSFVDHTLTDCVGLITFFGDYLLTDFWPPCIGPVSSRRKVPLFYLHYNLQNDFHV